MKARVQFRMNGVGNAFLQEIGHVCPLCSAVGPAANTSGSLLVYTADRGDIAHHVLFDFGEGVVDSLIQYGVHRVDHMFNTHPHVDHFLGSNRLLMSRSRLPRDQAGKPIPVPLWCTSETWKYGVGWFYPWYPDAGFVQWKSLDGRLSTDRNPGGTAVASIDWSQVSPGLGINLRVTPVPVYHGNARGPVVFVVQFCANGVERKIILCWDLLHLVAHHPKPAKLYRRFPRGNCLLTSPDPNEDEIELRDPAALQSYVPWPKAGDWRPGTPGYPGDDQEPDPKAHAAEDGLTERMKSIGPEDLLAEHQILRDADELFLEGNTCEPCPVTRHISITAGFSLIRRLNPKRTWIVHYSGHEDPWGPFSHSQLQDWIDHNKSTNGCASRDVRVAHHGMTLAF